MEKLTFDTGLQRFRVNGGGVLTFNPGDPNLYARVLEAVEKIQALEEQLNTAQPEALQVMCRLDQEMKEILGWVFGPGNDFDSMLGGVNLLAVAENGERVVTNLFAALEPILVAGAEACAGAAAEAAVQKAQARREAR